MPNNWKKYKLQQVAEIKYGKDHKLLKSGNIPVYGSGGIMRFGDNFLYDKPSILIPRKGTLSNLFYVDKPFWSVDTMFWSKIADGTDAKFLYYNLKTLDLASMDVGSAVPSLTTELLNRIELTLPPLPEQQAIAEILSSLDDKIELNLQTNKTLEEMANALYKHWFVDFGPFQHGRFVESELGLIPEGWEVANLKSLIVDFNNKRGPISSMEREKIKGNYPYYGATGILDYVNKFGFDGRYILVAEDGTVKNNTNNPYLQYIEGKFWVSNHAHIIRGNADYPDSFIYYTLSNTIVLPYITGAVQPKLSKGSLESIVILKPTPEAAVKYSKIVDEYVDLIFQKNYEIENLKQTRDYLLPKLISGEIRVKDAAKKN